MCLVRYDVKRLFVLRTVFVDVGVDGMLCARCVMMFEKKVADDSRDVCCFCRF